MRSFKVETLHWLFNSVLDAMKSFNILTGLKGSRYNYSVQHGVIRLLLTTGLFQQEQDVKYTIKTIRVTKQWNNKQKNSCCRLTKMLDVKQDE